MISDGAGRVNRRVLTGFVEGSAALMRGNSQLDQQP